MTRAVRVVRALVIVLAAYGVPARVHAQATTSDRRVEVGLAIGPEHFTPAFTSDTHGVGAAFGMLVQVPLSRRHLSVRGDLMLHRYFEGGSCYLLTNPGPCAGAPFLSLVSLSADLVARLNDPRTWWSPYALAGTGLYVANDNGRAPTPVGWQAGAGFEVRVRSGFNLFAEWRYMGMASVSIAPVTVGFRAR